MNGRLTVAVIMGGASSEREVSFKSGRAVAASLDPAKFAVREYDPPADIGRLVAEAAELDVALVMLHGRGGEDGAMQGLLELLGVPYQCAGVLGCALAMMKPMAKEHYRLAGIPVAREAVLRRGQSGAVEAARKVGLPVVVKPACEGSSFGVTMVHQDDDLAPAIKAAFKLDRVVLVEELLTGREVTCGVIGNQDPTALPLVEIIPSDKYDFFDYEAKYLPGATNEVCPAPLDQATTALIQELGVKAHVALGLEGYSRSDFILTESGPVILETNTIPGMTETSLLPQAAAEAGMDFPTLVERLIALALDKAAD